MPAEPLRCDCCGRVVDFPYECKRCGGVFCVECHLPEEHRCPALRWGRLFRSFKRVKKNCCDYCGKTDLLFECRYCGGHFCAEHHLPPNHECVNLERWKARPPPGITTRYRVIGGGAPRAVSYSGVDVPAGWETSADSARAATSFDAREGRRVRVKVEEPDEEEEERLRVLQAMLLWLVSLILSLALICWLTQSFDLPHIFASAVIASYVAKYFYDSERKGR